MPIIIDRKTGEVISAPVLTQAQTDYAWELIVRSWAKRNPDKLIALGDNHEANNDADSNQPTQECSIK